MHKISWSMPEKIRQDTLTTFRENFGLKITIKSDLKIANFLDLTFDLCARRYQAYKNLTHMLAQIICLISTSHCQITFQNE